VNVDVPAQSRPTGAAGRPNFFDDYPRFFETSKTVPFRDRLNLRYEAIFAENRDVFAGARVLDIASHDGRWSFAALMTGAAHVVGIEGRPELVANAEATFQQYGIDRERYRFIAADIFEAVADAEMRFDVVLCLGFLYHTLRYNELLSHIHRMEPHHLIVDTLVLQHEGPLVKLRVERVARQANAIADRFSTGDSVVSGLPSKAALGTLLAAYDFELERLSDWTRLLRENPGARKVGDYAAGTRITARARAVEPGTAQSGHARGPGRFSTRTAPAKLSLTRRVTRRVARDFAPPALTRWVIARRPRGL
jgi:Methyltransferase domain